MEASEPVQPQPSQGSRTLTIRCSIESLARVRDFVTAAAAGLGISDHDTYHFQLAADEACTNIIQHGAAGLPAAGSIIVLDLCSHEAGWTLTIRDHGRPFDPTGLPPPDLRSGLRRRKPGGLGVYLIRTLMDDVQYRSAGGENCLCMTKRRPSR